MLLELEIATPYLNAAGTSGFAPAAAWNWQEPSGAFVTNPISLAARTPAHNRAVIGYPGGCLLHTGLPNPGLRSVLHHHAAAWKRSSVPIWVHLLAEKPEEIHQMVLQLEEVGAVAAVEVGIPPHAEPALALELLSAALGELPVIAAVGLNAASQPWLERLPALGLRALTLNAPRGTLPAANGALISGRLCGAGLFPQILTAVRALRSLGLPLIAGVGVHTAAHARTLLSSGAAAVQLDTVLWR